MCNLQLDHLYNEDLPINIYIFLNKHLQCVQNLIYRFIRSFLITVKCLNIKFNIIIHYIIEICAMVIIF